MQNQNLNFLLENVVSSKQMAQHLQATEDDIENLCKKEVLRAKYLNNEWAILKNQELPCLIQFNNIDMLNKDNYKILHDQDDCEESEELAYWPIEVFEDDYFLGFQHICIVKKGYKNPFGNLYNRYILEIETFIEVASWTDSMENVLLKAEEVIISPQKNEFVAVFDSEAEAFKCANKLYPEFPLEEYIIEMYD